MTGFIIFNIRYWRHSIWWVFGVHLQYSCVFSTLWFSSLLKVYCTTWPAQVKYNLLFVVTEIYLDLQCAAWITQSTIYSGWIHQDREVWCCCWGAPIFSEQSSTSPPYKYSFHTHESCMVIVICFWHSTTVVRDDNCTNQDVDYLCRTECCVTQAW